VIENVEKIALLSQEPGRVECVSGHGTFDSGGQIVLPDSRNPVSLFRLEEFELPAVVIVVSDGFEQFTGIATHADAGVARDPPKEDCEPRGYWH
jgi:hypothetical protein